MSAPVSLSRIARFESLGYGLFLHWGLYSLLGQGEWTLHHHRRPREDYERLVEQFSAEDWDAPALARWAKDAGFRYVCLTTRHHDGFSLYDTRGLNTYDAPHSAAGRDLVAEFAEACRAEGLGVFFYHTTLDWWHPDFTRDWDAYQRYLRDSVEILCTHYGPVDGLWFDGNWWHADRDWQEDALYGLIRRLQPEAIVINNSSVAARGRRGHPEIDVLTFEQGAPTAVNFAAEEKYLAREMCETFNRHWGTATAGDFDYKSPAEIIRSLALCRRHGANFLMNVGLLPSGALPAYERAALDLVGAWIRRQPGLALFTAHPAPDLATRGRDFVLRDGDTLHYHAYDLATRDNWHLPGEGDNLRTVAGSLPKIATIAWNDTGETLRFDQSPDGTMLTFEATANPYGAQAVVRVARITPA